MPKYCSLKGCGSNNLKNKDIKMHSIPKNLVLRNQWLKAIQEHNLYFIPTNNSVICSKHFLDTDYKIGGVNGNSILSKTAVPSIFVNCRRKIDFNYFNSKTESTSEKMVSDIEESKSKMNNSMFHDHDHDYLSSINIQSLTEGSNEENYFYILKNDNLKKKVQQNPEECVENANHRNALLVNDSENDCSSILNKHSLKDSSRFDMAKSPVNDVVIQSPLMSSTPIIKKRKRKIFVGDFEHIKDIDSPNSRLKYWNISKKTITKK